MSKNILNKLFFLMNKIYLIIKYLNKPIIIISVSLISTILLTNIANMIDACQNAYQIFNAEDFSEHFGMVIQKRSANSKNIYFDHNGDYLVYSNIDFGSNGAKKFISSMTSIHNTGTIEIRLDNPNGMLVGTCKIPKTEHVKNWSLVISPLKNTKGIHDLYLVCTNTKSLLKINWFTFTAH